MTGLGDLPGGSFFSEARGVSADGSVVAGESYSSASEREAFVWEAQNGMRSVRDVLANCAVFPVGWQMQTANDISPDGRHLAGDGVDPSGIVDGWVASLCATQAVPVLPRWALGLFAAVLATSGALPLFARRALGRHPGKCSD